MKKIILIAIFMVYVLTASHAQVRFGGEHLDNSSLENSPAFLDATSHVDSKLFRHDTSKIEHKGLIFPKVDLSKVTSFPNITAGVTTAFNTYLDGMIVYNIATKGVAGVGKTEGTLSQGYWYYDNKDAASASGGTTGKLKAGTWRPLRVGPETISDYIHNTFLGDTISNYVLRNLNITGSKGIIINRNGTQVDISLPSGNNGQVLVYNSTTNKWEAKDSPDEKGWELTGNSNATATSFLGTTNTHPLQFKVNSQKAGYMATAVGAPTAFGYQAANSSPATSGHATAFGYQALMNNTGAYNTAVGNQSLMNNSSAGNNTAVGYNTLKTNTTGAENIAIGSNALIKNKAGNGNIAIGYNALSETTGGYNIHIGRDNSTQSITTGNQNIVIGSYVTNPKASSQLAIAYAIYGTDIFSTGTARVGIGERNPFTRLHVDGRAYTTIHQYVGGRLSVGDGARNLAKATTSDTQRPGSGIELISNASEYGGDISIHSYKGTSTVGGKYIPTINFYAARGTHASPKHNVENDELGSLIFWPRIGTDYPLAYAARIDVYYMGKNKTKMSFGADAIVGRVAFTKASDRRLKTNIKPIKYGLADVMKLNPVDYVRIDDPETPQVGFIAQEVREIIPELVTGEEGDLEAQQTLSVAYADLTPVLTKAIQEQQTIIEQQQATINMLLKRIEALENK